MHFPQPPLSPDQYRSLRRSQCCSRTRSEPCPSAYCHPHPSLQQLPEWSHPPSRSLLSVSRLPKRVVVAERRESAPRLSSPPRRQRLKEAAQSRVVQID